MDLHERSVSQRNALERLAAMIPGFQGYMDREARRDVDKVQRDFCADTLMAQKNRVKKVLDELISDGDIDGITPFEKLLNRIDKVAQDIKFADRGWSGLFDTVKVDDEVLRRLHEYDLSLAEAVSEVEHKVKELDPSDKSKLMTQVKETIGLLDRVDEYFGRREQMLRNPTTS